MLLEVIEFGTEELSLYPLQPYELVHQLSVLLNMVLAEVSHQNRYWLRFWSTSILSFVGILRRWKTLGLTIEIPSSHRLTHIYTIYAIRLTYIWTLKLYRTRLYKFVCSGSLMPHLLRFLIRGYLWRRLALRCRFIALRNVWLVTLE